MLQKTFSIYADNLDNCTLYIEAGNRHIACWCKDAETGAAKAFEFFQFNAAQDNGMRDVLKEVRLHSRLMDLSVSPTLVWDNEEAMYIPAAFYDDDLAGDYLTAMFGDGAETQPFAQYSGDTVVLSRQHVDYINVLKEHFTPATTTHKFFLLLQWYMNSSTAGEAGEVHVIFYPSHFIITVVKDRVLQLIRSVNYSTSEDVLYSIINTCNQYGVPLQTTRVTASGLIDTTSNLYTTLYSYLETFTLQKSSDTVFAADGFAEYPAHFFLPFIQ